MRLLRPKPGWPEYLAGILLVAGVIAFLAGSWFSVLAWAIAAAIYIGRDSDPENAFYALIFMGAVAGTVLGLVSFLG